MIATFDQPGLHFHYPENWKITDESLVDWPRTVSVQSPGSGFWTVVQYELGSDPESLLKETLDEMRAEYENLESSVVVDQFEETDVIGYEMFFYCFDFLVCARAFAARTVDGKVTLILWQAEDRDFAQMEPVFRAITISLFRDRAADEGKP
jgi:hypothetical protein